MAPKKKGKKVVKRVATKKKVATKRRVDTQIIRRSQRLQIGDKIKIDKLNAKQVDKLKGKLVQVKRAGSSSIFVEVTKKDSIRNCLINADIPIEDAELKIEAIKNGSKKWEIVKENNLAINYEIIAVTTKVRGSS